MWNKATGASVWWEEGGAASGEEQDGGCVDVLTRGSSKLYKPIIIQTF